MSFQEALERYCRRVNGEWMERLEAEGYTFSDFDVTHEPYWQSDAGTGFPEDTTIVCKKTKIGKKGQKHTSKQEFATRESNPVDLMRVLFEESE